MIKKIVLLSLIVAFAGCSSSKPTIVTTKKAAAAHKPKVAASRKPIATKSVKNAPSNNTTEVIQSTSRTVVTSV
jgi:uncharacterized lipoprotein YajG